MTTANARVFRREPGDWSCQQCNEINFKPRTVCRRCSTARNGPATTNSTASSQYVPRQGDWNCHFCNIMNYASRNACFKCGRQKQESMGSNNKSTLTSKPDDWVCHPCQTNNFSEHTACHKSNRPKPISMKIDASVQKAAVKPGDWKCSSCPEMNFGSRVVCRACGAARPSIETNNSNNKSECVICMDKPIDSVITTCGHSAVCLECSGSITQCPICRNPFNQQQIIKVYNVH